MYELRVLLLAVVAITSLPRDTSAAGQCTQSSLNIASEVDEALNLINAARTRVLKGEQVNGLSEENLPAAASMPNLKWNCDLEELALQDLVGVCFKNRTQADPNKAYFRRSDSSAISLPRIISFYLSAAEYTALTSVVDKVTFNSEADLLVYVNLIRNTTTEIGCARYECASSHANTKFTTLCITNQPNLKAGEEIYEMAPNACPGTPHMNNLIRAAFLNRHNNLRSQLALGVVTNGKTGKMCRRANHMRRLVYDCKLEEEAYKRASLCERFTLDTTSLKENSHNYTERLDRTFVQAAQGATQLWWSEMKVSSGFTTIKPIFYTHLGISRFAKIASDSNTKIGCSIYRCPKMVNIVCHYDNALKNGQLLYSAGPTCNKCNDTCYNSLCPSATTGAKI